MQCLEGFDFREAKATGICTDCGSKFCPDHPQHLAWRKENGFLPRIKTPPTVVAPPVQLMPHFKITPIQAPPVPQIWVGYKRGCLRVPEAQKYAVRLALQTMSAVARGILAEEGLHYSVQNKEGVWATYCSYSKHLLQFGEGCALLHLNGGKDTVAKEMLRYGWARTPENGWLMVVLHEVAHAVAHYKYPRSQPHGFEFHQTLRDLRSKYFERFRPSFNNILIERKAADSLV